MRPILVLGVSLVLLEPASAAPVHVGIRNDLEAEMPFILNGEKLTLSPGGGASYVSENGQFEISFDGNTATGVQPRMYRLGHNGGNYNFYRKGNSIDLNWDRKGVEIPLPKQPIWDFENDSFISGKYVQSTAILNPNGLLTIDSHTQNLDWKSGFRCRVYVVLFDSKGNTIYTTKLFKCTTRGSIFDPNAKQSGTNNFQFQVPKKILVDATRLDVRHCEAESPNSFFDNVKKAIKTAEKLKKYKEEIAALVALLGAYGDTEANYAMGDEEEAPAPLEDVIIPDAK